MIIIIYILAIASLVGAVFIAWEFFQGYLCKNWPTCNGSIVQSKFSTLPNNKKEKVAHIYYKYTVKGKEYLSRRLAMHVSPVFKNIEAEKMLEKYPKDKGVIVRYHPFFHAFAVIESGPRQPYIHFFLFLVFLVVFLISLITVYMPGFNPIFEVIHYFNK